MKRMMKEKNHQNGITIALIAMILGIIVWIIVWSSGFNGMIGLVALGIVLGVFKGYEYGAGEVGRKQIPLLAIWSIVGVLLAFFGGIVSGVWVDYKSQLGGLDGFFSTDFLSHIAKYITETTTYLRDLITAIVITLLGIASLAFDFTRVKPATEEIEA